MTDNALINGTRSSLSRPIVDDSCSDSPSAITEVRCRPLGELLGCRRDDERLRIDTEVLPPQGYGHLHSKESH